MTEYRAHRILTAEQAQCFDGIALRVKDHVGRIEVDRQVLAIHVVEELQQMDQQIRLLRRDDIGCVGAEFRILLAHVAALETDLKFELFGNAG